MPSTGLNSTTGILLCCQQKLIQHFLQSAAIYNASKYLSSYFTEPFWILPTSKSLSQKAFVSLIILIPTCMLTAASMNLFLLLLLSSLFQSPLFKSKQKSPLSSLCHLFLFSTSIPIYLVFYVLFSNKSLANTQNSFALLTP